MLPVTARISTGRPPACILAKLRARKSKLFKELREILGDLDDDLILIQMDIKLKKKQLEKKSE